jgi:hypothetical protein
LPPFKFKKKGYLYKICYKFFVTKITKRYPMSIITQKTLFKWKDLENLGDLKRLKLVLENIPDKRLLNVLSHHRCNGRNDYPIHAMWNSLLAAIVFQHNSIESLIRELLRNESLRIICGFDPYLEVEKAVPKSWNYTRFLRNLFKFENEIDKMFQNLLSKIKELLPDFGSFLAHDGKAIQTHAKYKKQGYKSKDGRRDTDANIGVKKYSGIDKNGKLWEKFKSWFGYKLHLIIDANYELPIAFELTKASEAETPIVHNMIDKLAITNPDILKKSEYFTSDKGNDDEKLITKLWKKHKTKAVIDIRNMWKDPDSTKGLSTGENVIYNYKGDVSCVCPKTGDIKSMSYGGFEKDRSAHKYRCPMIYKGLTCKGSCDCNVYSKKYIRISMKENRRIFPPVARSSYKWKLLYKKRTSVERVNSRIDEVFCFEKHFIKGLKKMKIRLSLVFCVMLSMAIGRINENRLSLINSYTKIE